MGNQINTLKMGQRFKKTPAGEIPVDWDVIPVQSLTQKMLNGGTPDRSVEKYWNGKIPWISGADFSEQKVAEVRRFITPEAVENSSTNVIPKGALLIVSRTGVGKLAIAPFDIAISQDITGVVPNPERISSEFLFWMLNFHIPKLKANHQGTSINGILREDLESFPLPVPVLKEQGKIVEILTAVNNLVDKVAAEIEKTKELKKGLMRQLLTRGIGHKKIKKTPLGQSPTEWKVKKIEEIAQLHSGGTPSREKLEYFGGTIPWVKSGELNHSPITETEEYITETGLQNSSAKLVPENTVLVALYGATAGQVAMLKIKAAINQAILAVLPTAGISKDYLYFVFKFISPKLISIMQGSGQPNLSQDLIASTDIPVPPINEQREIADILSGLDAKIKETIDVKNKIEELKKGLMEVLLTGKVRVI